MNTVQVTDEVQDYLDSLLPARDPVLARMEEEAHGEGIPIVDAHEGAFLSLLVRIAGSKRLLELGTAIGYSGIWLLRATSGGTLTTFETNHERAVRARSNFAGASFWLNQAGFYARHRTASVPWLPPQSLRSGRGITQPSEPTLRPLATCNELRTT